MDLVPTSLSCQGWGLSPAAAGLVPGPGVKVLLGWGSSAHPVPPSRLLHRHVSPGSCSGNHLLPLSSSGLDSLGFVVLQVFSNLNDPMILLIPFFHVVHPPCTLSCASIVCFPSAAPWKVCALHFSPLERVCSLLPALCLCSLLQLLWKIFFLGEYLLIFTHLS